MPDNSNASGTIDQVLALRLRGERRLFRVQKQTRTLDGPNGPAVRVLLKGEPEVLRRLEGYAFTPGGSDEVLTIVALRLVPPPGGGEAWLAVAEARPAPILAAQTIAAPRGDPRSTAV